MIGVFQIIIATVGCIIGIIFGALPGMTATMAVAVFLPLTYLWDLGTSLYFLLGLYVGGITGGLIPAILINIPGTPSSLTTTFDGHPMAKRGEGIRALKIGIFASLFGGIFSLIILAVLTPILSKIAINFGAVEKFLIILFAMTIIAALSKGNLLKGVFTGMVGVLVALVGIYEKNQTMRFVPSQFSGELRDGFQLLPLLVGLFAISQMLEEAEDGMIATIVDDSVVKGKQSREFNLKGDFKGQGMNLIRSSAVGCFMGILPGVGGSAASILSYSEAKRWSKEPEKLGTGVSEGLVASESSNNGLTGGALVPLLSLGIPGDSTTAVMLGAFTLQGISVGPLFIEQNPEIWYGILIALLVCNLITFALMFFPVKYLANIIKIPKSRLYPAIFILCVVGAFSTRNGVLFDVITLVAFGAIAYVFGKFGLPITTFLIGFILGGDLENYFMDAIQGSQGSLTVFFKGPISWVLWIIIIISLALAIRDDYRETRTKKENVLKQ